ncbi:YggT family protein [Corynebacterium sp. ES2794-CONJ1]|uniref:YggT family protein n=1 Tax=unclassified Corynebacterium TaxID=2624378 RepID=UPI00216A1112|nr:MULTISPECIES: YggT family protein [unclassified Corynebacterium]MCS4489021.1 YggT family protein [Corynebacterium sp. ES2775-CONJ]MCS4490834.1 YggT family protein [Corynebacterium sp. ES2715-CONJ3]MCS4531283.1 YggT family protein [Corynebacterium sp. ES2730-CONJ]MCU9518652.1 YggT family protein [Corynebacterium sp. ES2794-CONJ1]
METIKIILLWAIELYLFVLIARILVEMIVTFSRNYSAPSWFNRLSEAAFVVTDPPVKALRRVVPPLPLGGVSLDVSILILFFALSFSKVLIAVLL